MNLMEGQTFEEPLAELFGEEAIKLEAIASRLEAIASRLEAIAYRLAMRRLNEEVATLTIFRPYLHWASAVGWYSQL